MLYSPIKCLNTVIWPTGTTPLLLAAIWPLTVSSTLLAKTLILYELAPLAMLN